MGTTDPSTPDQERLRRVANEVKAIMRREKLGGTLTLVSTESAEWLIELPEWSCAQLENGKVRIRMNSHTEQSRKLADSTAFLIAVVRDNALEYAQVFGAIFDQLGAALGRHGAKIEHTPFAGVGHGASGRVKN